MPNKIKLNVLVGNSHTGHEPVREWLKDLPKEDCKVIGADILTPSAS
jgi:hypothetical protein